MEFKQHITEQLMGQKRKSKETAEIILRQIKMEIQHTKIYRMQQKQF